MVKDVRKIINNGRSTSSKSVFVISDGHVGSTLAPCSPDPVISNQETEFKPNTRNRMLYEFVTNCQDYLLNGVPYIGIFNGEPVDGPDNRGRGKETWSNDMYDQVVDAVKVFRNLKIQKSNGENNWFFTTGSGYHVYLNGNTPIEEFVAKEMNAKKWNMYGEDGFDRYTDNVLSFTLNGRVFNIAHPITGSLNFMYRATPLAKEMMLLKLESGRAYPEEYEPTVVIRSHTHKYTHVSYTHSKGWVTAGLQLTNRFQFNQGIAGKFNDIGVLEIIVEPNGRVEHNYIAADPKVTQINHYDTFQLEDIKTNSKKIVTRIDKNKKERKRLKSLKKTEEDMIDVITQNGH